MNVERGDQLMTAYRHHPSPAVPRRSSQSLPERSTATCAVQIFIDQTRAEADAFIFLAGGASRISDSTREPNARTT